LRNISNISNLANIKISIELLELSDEDLFERIKTDDVNAFNVFYQRYSKKIFNYCMTVFRDSDKAKDVFQTIISNIYEKKDNFKGGSLIAWTMIITRNQCLMEKRNTKDKYKVEVYENTLIDDNKVEDFYLKEQIYKSIDTLPDEYKEVIELRYFSDFSYTEIAQVLNITEALVKVRLFRAKNLLTTKMENLKGYLNG